MAGSQDDGFDLMADEALQAQERAEADLFRSALTKYLEAQPRGARSKVARKIGVSEGWLTKFLRGQYHSVTLAKARRIADSAGFPVARALEQLGVRLRPDQEPYR